jgi:penicillin-binding protein 1A
MLRSPRHRMPYFLRVLILFLMTLMIFVGVISSYMVLYLPDITRLNAPHSSSAVMINQVPLQLIHAVLATEDNRFYTHPGVDLLGIARATLAVIAAGKKTQGASTITMQVARHYFLTPQKTYTRKIKEILLALKIEYTFSKNKILELYLNTAYFGHDAYGICAAARVYYHKPLDALTLPEMAMIAGLLQAPSRVNPITNKPAAIKRRNHVLKRMLRAGYIDQTLYDKAIAEKTINPIH